MNNSLSETHIRLRIINLSSLEMSARSALGLAGVTDWPLGDAIKATLADVRSLLDAQSDDETRPIVSALVGTLRAHGYTIHKPAWGEESACPPKSDTTPATPVLNDGSALDHRGDGLEWRCPNCEAPIAPGETCARYLDCQRKPLEVDDHIRIVGGVHNGRCARVDAKKPGSLSLCVVLLGKSVEIVGAVDVPHERVVVVGDDPDAPTAEPAAERTRNEPPCLARDWAPTAAQVKGYAKDLGITEGRTVELITEFKARPDLAAPQARWGGTFKAWAVDRLPAV